VKVYTITKKMCSHSGCETAAGYTLSHSRLSKDEPEVHDKPYCGFHVILAEAALESRGFEKKKD